MAAPAAPSNLTATAITASRIDLTWQDNSSDEDNFELERSTTGVGGWTLIDSPAADATSYSDTSLPASADLYYRIRATNGDGDSAYSAVASVLAIFAGRVLTPRLYLLQPEVVLAARVNMGSATYPLDSLEVDGATTGAVSDAKAGMTLLLGSAAGLDDYGRQRVRLDGAGTTLYVGRSSRGTHDGELTIVNDAYVTVWNDRRVWAKIPYIDADGVIYKDSALVVGDNTTDPPPVANTGPPQAGTIDPDTEVITCFFDGQESFAVADGATITDYLWDIDDGTLVAGSALDEVSLFVTFPAGFRYVSLTVTDSNGNEHTAYCAIYARDPDDDTSFDAFQIENRRATEGGVSMTIRILEDMPRATYPDGTLALMWDEEPAGRPLLMFGWLDTENATIGAGRNGLLRDTTLTILDVANKLDALPGFPQSLADDSTRDTDLLPDITWNYMIAPNLDKYLHYLLHWHSTALEVADFVWSGTTTEYPFVLLSSDGDSLWNQVDRRARAFVPDRVLTCSPSGEIRVVPDPMLQDEGDRTSAVQANILESSWSDLRFEYRRAPRVHWLRASAILAGSTEPIGTVFSIAPGDAPGQGVGEVVQGEQLALNQGALNAATGHRYARVNNRLGLITVTLIQDDDSNLSTIRWREIDPSAKEWVTLSMGAEYAAQRGLTFATARFLPKEVNERYNHDRTGLTRTVTLTLELETVGEPGKTVLKPVVPAVGTDPAPFVPPVPGDSEYFYGDINAYVMWTSAHVFRTWNLQATTPVWELVDTDITGTIYAGQYVFVDANTVGMWLMTSDAIWWCADIMAATPSWDDVLTIATVQAADATPAVGVVQFKTMFPYWSEPGFLCVATGPAASSSNNESYQHAYFWHTHDYGQSWTQIDANNILRTVSTFTHGYFHASVYAMNIERAAPGTIWCVRYTPNISAVDVNVLKSTDGGHTWSKEAQLTDTNASNNWNSLLNPFPDAGDPSYAVAGSEASAVASVLEVSTDSWATKTTMTAPTGYTGIAGVWRVNKRTFDDLHILAWWYHTSEAQWHLLETNDGGTTWDLLYDSGLNNGSIGNFPMGTLETSRHNTPNGWPPDVDQWVMILCDNFGAPSTNLVQLTLDNFSNLLDKTGNLIALGGAWPDGANDGFALPRVGPNA